MTPQFEEETKGGFALGQNEEERFCKLPLNLTCLHTSTLNINYTICFLLMECELNYPKQVVITSCHRYRLPAIAAWACKHKFDAW